MAIGGLPRAAADRCRAAEAGDRAGVSEPPDVAGLGDDCGGEVRAGAVEVGEWVLVFCEQLGDLSVEISDAGI